MLIETSWAVVACCLLLLVAQHWWLRGNLNISSLNSNAAFQTSSTAVPTRATFQIANYGVRGPLQWKCLSETLKREFTMDGNVSLRFMTFFHNDGLTDDSVIDHSQTTGQEEIWTASELDRMVGVAKARDFEGKLGGYGAKTNKEFFAAFDAFPVKGKDVLVIGSLTPWVEAICIAFGAKTVTTVDFNVPLLDKSLATRLATVSVEDLGKHGETFDALVSYSSLEHDGLGRYGDPINPSGDLERVEKLKQFVRRDGLFYLGFSTAHEDILYWNAHRVYGNLRFPLLIQGWERVASVWNGAVHEDWPDFKEDQPIHVLRLK